MSVMKVISTNVAVRHDDPSGRHDFTGIDKQPEPQISVSDPGPSYGYGSGVENDSIGDSEHHGGRNKAVYAFAREELDYWEDRLGRGLPDGHFGENLTTEGVTWAEILINQRIRIGTAELEVSVPRTPCATFSGWIGEPGWLKSFRERGDCGAYFRVAVPGVIRAGDGLEFIGKPAHGVTMGRAFAAALGNIEAMREVVEAKCLPQMYHDRHIRKLAARKG